jgi:hypothetical protein
MSSSAQPKKWWQTTGAIFAGVVVVIICFCSGSFSLFETFTAAATTVNTPATATSGSASTATTLASTPTTTPTVPPTATAPTCNPGAICYRADWSHGLDGWQGGREWKVLSPGVLTNDGSGPWFHCGAVGDITPTITAPYQPPTPNYTVSVQMRAPRGFGVGCFAIGARITAGASGSEGYCAGVTADSGYFSDFDYITDRTGALQSKGRNDPGTGWHTYTFTLKDSSLTLSIDGIGVVTLSDDKYLQPGQIGLLDGTGLSPYSSGIYLEVRNFFIKAA